MAKVTRARLEELKRRARSLVPPSDGCACRYVDAAEVEPLAEEERQQVESNVLCFERHKREKTHVGFSVVVVAAHPFRRNDGEELNDEEDDAPLVA